MREVAERRQQLELEHEQALAILKFKQDEIKRLQRVRTTPPCAYLIFFLKKSNPKAASKLILGIVQQEAAFGHQ